MPGKEAVCMWSRRELKQRAKAVLKTNYWKAFLISLVILLATGGDGGGEDMRGSQDFQYDYGRPFPDFYIDDNFIISIMMAFLAALGVIAFFIALRILLGYPLEVGGRRYFVQSASYNNNRGCFRFAFKGSNYKNIVLPCW
jgi:hypothetical protein